MKKSNEMPKQVLTVEMTAEMMDPLIDCMHHSQGVQIPTLITSPNEWAVIPNAATIWASDTSDPWHDIDTLRYSMIESIGRMPNIAVMGWQTWWALDRHPDFLDRIRFIRRGFRLEVNDLRGWFGFNQVLTGVAAGAVAWRDMFFVGYIPEIEQERDVANG